MTTSRASHQDVPAEDVVITKSRGRRISCQRDYVFIFVRWHCSTSRQHGVVLRCAPASTGVRGKRTTPNRHRRAVFARRYLRSRGWRRRRCTGAGDAQRGAAGGSRQRHPQFILCTAIVIFLLGEAICWAARSAVLPDSVVIDLYGHPTLLLHGDTLCTEDREYLAFRAQVRNPQFSKPNDYRKP